MGFDKQAGVSVLELILYVPSLVVATLVCKCHGFSRSAGFLFTLILCLVRIIGACCQLATISTPSKGLYEAVLILESVGLSPLLLATLGLLSRCADTIAISGGKGTFSTIHFRLVQLLITVGLILGIVGGTSSITPKGTYQPQTTSKVGVVLYLLALIALGFIAITSAMKLSKGPQEDTRIAWITILALPFIFVRLLYSFLSIFSGNKTFNPATGSVIIHVFMAILEEWIVVFMFLVIGWMTKGLGPEARGPIASRPWTGNLVERNVGSGNRRG